MRKCVRMFNQRWESFYYEQGSRVGNTSLEPVKKGESRLRNGVRRSGRANTATFVQKRAMLVLQIFYNST